jgi:hypothetical protein
VRGGREEPKKSAGALRTEQIQTDLARVRATCREEAKKFLPPEAHVIRDARPKRQSAPARGDRGPAPVGELPLGGKGRGAPGA